MNEENKVNDEMSVLNALKEEFSTNVSKVFVNSIQKEVSFKEATVKDQKTISKILIQNEDRKDVEYDVQCQLINKLALTEGFDIYRMTEFDRIKILLEIYQNNYTNEPVKYKCPKCGIENSFIMDFAKVISGLDKIEVNDYVFSYEDQKHKYEFTLGYPIVKRMSEFYKTCVKKYPPTKNIKQRENNVTSIGIDSLNLFIKTAKITKKADDAVIGSFNIERDHMFDFNWLENFLEIFPQHVLFDKTGVMTYIMENYYNNINKLFDKPKCGNCGDEYEETVGGMQDFF